METKHTPGKWTIIHVNNVIGIESENQTVCLIRKNDYDPSDEYQIDANSKLIVAAPELLYALDELQFMVQRHLTGEIITAEEFDLCRQQAIKAIKKATE